MDEKNRRPTQLQLPRYRCHKEVWAVKIASVQREHIFEVGGALIHTDDRGPSFEVDAEYLEKHDPQPGGYFIIYKDGYESYSPAAEFEEGYTRIEASPYAEPGETLPPGS